MNHKKETLEQKYDEQYKELLSTEETEIYQSGLKVFLAAEELGLSPKVYYATPEGTCIETNLHDIYINEDGEVVDKRNKWYGVLGIDHYTDCDEFISALREYVVSKKNRRNRGNKRNNSY